jgi:hypothetical protein
MQLRHAHVFALIVTAAATAAAVTAAAAAAAAHLLVSLKLPHHVCSLPHSSSSCC